MTGGLKGEDSLKVLVFPEPVSLIRFISVQSKALALYDVGKFPSPDERERRGKKSISETFAAPNIMSSREHSRLDLNSDQLQERNPGSQTRLCTLNLALTSHILTAT
jgi:hypothetical protein